MPSSPSNRSAGQARRAERAAAVKKKQRRTRFALGGGGVVVIIVVIVIVVLVTGGSSSKVSGPAPASVVTKATSVPVSALVAAENPKLVANGLKPIDTPALTVDGKPHIVYFGGEFCPYCAADRWVTVVALSQFGQWHDLRVTHSSSTDINPNTPTFSFHGASYTSPYLVFDGYELYNREQKPLDTAPKELRDLPSTVAASLKDDPSFNPQSIPFMDVGGKFVQSGSPYDPSILAHKSWQEVADALHVPASAISQTILANAAEVVQDICTLTNGQPANVCGAFKASTSPNSTAPSGGAGTAPSSGASSTTQPNATKLPTAP